MQRRRQRWGCQFLLKRSEDECLTERGMEFQNTGPMYWMDLSPRVFLPILDAGLRLPSSSGKGCRKARRGVPRVTACWCDPIQPFSPSAVVPRHCIKQGRLEFCKLVWPLSDLLSLPPRHWQCRQVCLNVRTELQWTAGWRPNPATLRASLSGRCRKPVLGVRAGSCQSLFCNNIMPNERKVTTRTTSLWMEVSGPRLTWVTKEGGFVRRQFRVRFRPGLHHWSEPLLLTVCLSLVNFQSFPNVAFELRLTVLVSVWPTATTLSLVIWSQRWSLPERYSVFDPRPAAAVNSLVPLTDFVPCSGLHGFGHGRRVQRTP